MNNHRNEKFAFIGHPPDLNIYREYIKFLKPEKTFRDELLIKLFEWTPSYKIKDWYNISIDSKQYVDGIMVMVPFIPEMREIKHKVVVKKIEQAISIAANEGCTVASLGAFTSIVLQGQEKDLSEKYNIKLTSGNTLTAAVIIKSIKMLTDQLGINLKDQTLAIIGASGDIGTGCLSYFGNKVSRMELTARGIPMLENIVQKHHNDITCDIEISNNNKNALKKADIVIFVTSAHTTLFSIDDFKPGTIVCDASAPLNVSSNGINKDNVFLYHGGILSLPCEFNLNFDVGLASTNHFYSCQIESILMAYNTDLPCSWGRGNITREKISRYIKTLDDNPLLYPEYTINNKIYTTNDIEHFKQYLK